MPTTFKCMCVSIPLIITFGYLSNSTLDYLPFVLLLCLYSMRDIYLKAPLEWEDVELDKRWYNCLPFSYIKFNRDKWNRTYDYKYYRKHMLIWLSLSYIIALIFLIIKLNLWCNCVLWNIIMADLMLFLNKDLK